MIKRAIISPHGRLPCPLPRPGTWLHPSLTSRAETRGIEGVSAVEANQTTRSHVLGLPRRNAYEIRVFTRRRGVI